MRPPSVKVSLLYSQVFTSLGQRSMRFAVLNICHILSSRYVSRSILGHASEQLLGLVKEVPVMSNSSSFAMLGWT